MKLRKIKRSKKNKQATLVLGVGWYQENQWDILLEHSEDKEELSKTYAGWLEGANKGIRNIEMSGAHPQKILIDVEEMIKWCKEKEIPLNGESRSNFIALKTKEKNSFLDDTTTSEEDEVNQDI